MAAEMVQRCNLSFYGGQQQLGALFDADKECMPRVNKEANLRTDFAQSCLPCWQCGPFLSSLGMTVALDDQRLL
jgi:hypothetical protein